MGAYGGQTAVNVNPLRSNRRTRPAAADPIPPERADVTAQPISNLERAPWPITGTRCVSSSFADRSFDTGFSRSDTLVQRDFSPAG